jgi:hypothetical protein
MQFGFGAINTLFSGTFVKKLAIVAFVLLLLNIGIDAEAYTKRVNFAESNEISDGMCKIYYFATSSVLRVICMFVLIVTALGFFLGKISWGMIISIAVAVGMIFSSEKLLAVFVGPKAEGGCQCKPGTFGSGCKAKPSTKFKSDKSLN